MSFRCATALAAFLWAILSHGPASRSEPNPAVHDCDRLAASSNDDRAVAPPVSDEDINVPRAIQACKAALNQFPNTSRFQAQLGRAFYKAGRDEEAVQWFLRAAERDYGYGMTSLGWMYREGRGVSQDDTIAVAWFRRGAEQGNAQAQTNLGWMFKEGRGVTQDDTQAVAWFRKAAEQGNAEGQANLGWMYVAGRGVPWDDAHGVGWFRKAAEQGNVWAQNTLGWMYSEGRGVAQDQAEAKKWYLKAAEAGFAEAKTALARLDPGGHDPASAARAEAAAPAPSARGDELDAQQKALSIIADFADRICTKVPLEGSGVEITLSGEAKAELNNLLRQIANLGIQGSGEYKNETYQGVLRDELATAIRNSDDCRLSVFEQLNDRLLAPNTQRQSCKISQFFEVCLIDHSKKGNVVSVSLSVKNRTDEDIMASMFREYAVLVSPTGERLSKSSNRFSIRVNANQTEYLSYDFPFSEPTDENRFDFTLKFEEPRSQFGFYNLAIR